MSAFNNINECSPITIFPLGVECVSINTSTPLTTDGSLTLNITGGTPPYEVTWSNGESSPMISGLSTGSYSATIVDYYGDYTATTTCFVDSDTFNLYKFTSCPNSGSTIYLSATTTELIAGKIYQLSNFTTGSCTNIQISYSQFLRTGSPSQLLSPLYLGVRHFTDGTTTEYYYSNGKIYKYEYPSVTNWGSNQGSFDGPQGLAFGQDLTCNGVTYDASVSTWIGFPNISYQGKTYTLWILPAVGVLSTSEGLQNVVLCCNDSLNPNCWTYLGQEYYTAQTISSNSSYFYDFDSCVECNPSLSDVPDTICLNKGIRTSPTPTPTLTPTPTVTPTITSTPTITPSITPSTSPNNLVSFYSCCGYFYFNVNITETVFPIIPNEEDTQIVVFTNESTSNPFKNNKCFRRVAFNSSYTTYNISSAGAVVFDTTVYTSCENCDTTAPCFPPSPTPTPTVTSTLTPTVTPTLTPGLSPSATPTNTPTNTPTPSITPTISLTPSITPTNTGTPTQTPSITPSSTVTNTPTPSVTPTITPGLSPTPTSTVTPTNTGTPTQTPSITPSSSVTPTISPSPTITPSITPTITPSPLFYLQQENGFYILQEDGSKIIIT